MAAEKIFKNIIIVSLIFSIGIVLFLPNVYALQEPPIIALVNEDPFYFGEGGFGLSLLEYLGFPVTAYLTDGVTEKSTPKEIMDAYYKVNSKGLSVVEQESDRAISYVLTVRSPEIFDDVVSYNFQLFNPEANSNEFTLQSLASKDNQEYYEFASRYINAGARPDPFDATIDVVTGDGTVIQKWQYFDCKVTYFEIYLQNNLMFLMYAGGIASEIRDKSNVECRASYLQADMDKIFSPYVSRHLEDPNVIKVYDTAKLNKLPSRDDKAVSFLVSFVGRDIPEEITFQTFGQFGQVGISVPEYGKYIGSVEVKPAFFLEGILSKDKQKFYEYISSYINPGKKPEPIDVTVDVVTGDGTALLRYQYYDCSITDFEAKLKDSLLTIKFHPGSSPEIRGHTEFQCNGFYLEADFEVLFSPYLNLPKTGEQRIVASEPGAIIPKVSDQAKSYVVHFSNGDFAETTKTIRTFFDFKQNALTEFNLQSLPSQDKNDLYDMLIAKSMNPGRQPDPFDVTVDIVTGDGTILQKWQYDQCQITNYQTKLNDVLTKTKYSGTIAAEIKETISFDCIGQNLVADPLKRFSPYFKIKSGETAAVTKESPGGVIPTDNERAMSYVVHIVGNDFPQETFTSFASFKTRGITVVTGGGDLGTIEQPGFTLQSIPSKDKVNFLMLLAKYVNPVKEPHPFDVTVDLVKGDNTILQRWNYFSCHIENYETMLSDNLLIIKYAPAVVEIRDKADFLCVGFHFDTPRMNAFSPYASLQKLSVETQISNETGGVVPSDNDRPMSYVVNFSGGDIIVPHTFLTISKYKQMSATQFSLESLPSQDKQYITDLLISRYINSGSEPQLFDVRVDLITGDGTVLESWHHNKCQATGYIIHSDSDLMFTRFDKKLNSEIREKTTFDCAGLNLDIEGKLPASIYNDLFEKGLKVKPLVPEIIVPPHKQLSSGTSANEIECKKEMELMYRPSNALPYCIKANSVDILQGLGWEHISKKFSKESTDESKTDSTILQAVVPADDERAMSFRISVIGKEVPEALHSVKFSNFAPFTTDNIIINTAKILGLPIPEDAAIHLSETVTVGNFTLAVDIEVPLEDLPLPIPTVTIPGDTSTMFGVVPHYQFGDKPTFYVESLPAKDKVEFYEWLSRYTTPGKTPDPVDVGIEFLDGSGNPIQTWMYRNCSVISYQIMLDDYILGYKFHQKWHDELKDRTMFSCDGLSLNQL